MVILINAHHNISWLSDRVRVECIIVLAMSYQYTTKKRRIQRRLYYAKHREELLLKKKPEYHANHSPERKRLDRKALDPEGRKGASELVSISQARPSHVQREGLTCETTSKLYYANYYARHREEILLKRKQRYHDNRKAKGFTSREYSKKKDVLNPKPKKEAKARYFVKHREGLVLKLQKFETSKGSEFDRKQQNLEEVVGKIARDIDSAQTMLEIHQGEGICQHSGDQRLNVACQGENSVCEEDDVALTVFTCQPEQRESISSVDFSHYKHDIVVLGVDSQADGSFLAKSQQRVDEMLTQLETETNGRQ